MATCCGRRGSASRANAKTIEGRQYPDRDAQFRYISDQVKAHQGSGDLVISVDTKKKELVGEFKNAGQRWRPRGRPVAARTHDFPRHGLGKARNLLMGPGEGQQVLVPWPRLSRAVH